MTDPRADAVAALDAVRLVRVPDSDIGAVVDGSQMLHAILASPRHRAALLAVLRSEPVTFAPDPRWDALIAVGCMSPDAHDEFMSGVRSCGCATDSTEPGL